MNLISSFPDCGARFLPTVRERRHLMTSTRRDKFRFPTSLGVHLLAGVALCSGCGSDGAGTIHIDAAKAKKLMMRTGSGVAPTAAAKPGLPGIPPKSVPRAAIRTPVRKND